MAAGVIVVWSVTAVACAGSAGRSARRDAVRVGRVVSEEAVALLPITVGAGDGGWCLTTIKAGGGSCPTLHLPAFLGPFQGPIVVEHWSGRSSSSQAPVREVMVLTTSEVAAVSLEGNAPVAIS